MRNLLYIVVTTVILAACVGGGKERAVLDRAQRIINDRPDSALAILDSLEPSSQDFSQENLRRWQLLRLMAQNKCDTVFRTDSLQKELVKYYDRHGTPNERMTAHYLLGRAYSDMGEAPLALHCYLDASACADTTSRACDFKTLFRIYGQLAFIYESQHLYKEEIESWNQFSHFSLKAGDTINYIRGKELMVVPYYAMDDTIKSLCLTEQCRMEYARLGYSQKAASVLPTAIYIHLLNSNYEAAREAMGIYEKESGLFDSCGNISKGREQYYYSKGLYYLGIQRNDSAELSFRKLLRYHVNKNYEAYKGLLKVFHARHKMDSIAKYAMLCENALDSIQAEDQSDAVVITHSLYSFNRMERIASEKTLESERRKILAWLISIASLLAIVAGIVIFQREKKKKDEELGRMSSERMEAIRKCASLEREIRLLEQSSKTIIEDKKKEFVKQKEQVAVFRANFDSLPDEKCEAAMQNDDIVLTFRKKVKGKRDTVLPQPSDWSLLKALLQENIPSFYNKVILNDGLSLQEIQTCILCRLDFHTGEIAVLLDTTSQRITNAKSSSNFYLFGEKKASSLSNNLKKI